MDVVRDEMIAELRSLRKGVGLTLAKLAFCKHLLAGLDTERPDEAYKRLIDILEGLGSDLPYGALFTAYGLNPSDLGSLTDRRGALSEATGRHVDTIKNYENTTIEEVAARILSGTKAESAPILVDLIVGATVHIGRIVNIHLQQALFEMTDEPSTNAQTSSKNYDNPYIAWPGLIHRIPAAAPPHKILTLILRWLQPNDFPHPKHVWAASSPIIYNVLAGNEREELKPLRNLRERDNLSWAKQWAYPKPQHYFAIWWEY